MTRIVVFLARRLTAGVFTLVVMITVTFAIFWLIPSDPANFLYTGFGVHLSDWQIKHGNHLLGVDRPKLPMYFHYLWHLLHFDFGHRWAGAQITAGQKLIEQPTAPAVWPPFHVTLSIVLGGSALVLLLAVPIGAFTGMRVGALSDRVVSLLTLLGVCTHPIVIGILAKALFADRLHWAPPSGYCPLVQTAPVGCGGLGAWASHLALPWLTYALLFLALYVRIVRAAVAEHLHEDYVRTARAKGAGELRVMTNHVLPSAATAVLTLIGMEVGTAIGVSIYIEAAYGLDGLGTLALQSFIGSLELPLILAVVTVITALVVAANLLVDAVCVLADPRVARGGHRVRTKSLAGGVI
jgi:peptide/nickel transport system permease protein